MQKTQFSDLMKKIRDTIMYEAKKEGIEVKNIILFGSRARGDHRVDSDWDILVVVDNNSSEESIKKLQLRIYRELTRSKIYCDVIVVRESYYVKYRNVVGTIAYYANIEGKSLG